MDYKAISWEALGTVWDSISDALTSKAEGVMNVRSVVVRDAAP
jgi:hypothetical protein